MTDAELDRMEQDATGFLRGTYGAQGLEWQFAGYIERLIAEVRRLRQDYLAALDREIAALQERDEARRAARRYVRSTACPEYHIHRYPWLGEEESPPSC